MNASDDLTGPCPLRLGRDICGELGQAERREWWLSNGRGAYAAGTVAGALTRRYHGLLTAVLSPPLGRMLVLAKADATLLDGEGIWPLFTNRWASGAVAPAGHVHIESFQLVGRLPLWRYAIGDLVVEHCLWLDDGRDQGTDRVRLAWRLAAGVGRDARLRVTLLANCRDHHAVSHPEHIQPVIEADCDRLTMALDDVVILGIRAQGGRLDAEPAWIEGFDLPHERERGMGDQDHHLRLGRALLQLTPGSDGPGPWVGLSAEVGRVPDGELGAALRARRRRDLGLIEQAHNAAPLLVGRLAGMPAPIPDWVQRLTLAADDFLFARPLPGVPDGESVIAGYPWFGDWGRDTMIALPGLTLATGRVDSARRILLTFARFVDGGMLPNRFPGAGETPEYNSVDAALWYLEAWRAYVEATADLTALSEVFPVLESIVAAYRDGTRFGIAMDPADGLIRAGEPGIQLTWMDARVGDWVVTPRIGKPVEISALWLNGLTLMADLAGQMGADSAPYRALAKRVRAGFQRYLRTDGVGLLDLLDGPHGNDASIRPNQLLAVSLPASPLDARGQARVLAACAQHLLTSYGLRSLAPRDPAYRGSYGGGVWDRDGAYHQGTVWGWLLGHYALAELRVTGDATRALSRLTTMADHLRDAGLGSCSEIFDGDPPHRPRGAPLQAWSVACTLEAWWRIHRVRAATADEDAELATEQAAYLGLDALSDSMVGHSSPNRASK